ncbi:phage terminase large subunit GpA-like protein [Paraburkholderia sp. BL6669N2]|uniref:phage terminase large subunit family protein n=1 Tax=Paraburkholderia sp. BL6669N2 TaxID=1938807 RepID=UPI000E251E33|nr:terminase gpA endonuclease subunit [Paraburkholderia sp. BL6669N2]REG58968.1 phage terminase large subunit GpA-like protein [Paraburkholderia sp. BL6669N2]
MGATEAFLKTITEAIRPDRRIGIAEWSEKHRVLPESSPEPGKWRNERTPYLVGIMDALSGQASAVTRYAHDDDRPFDNSRVITVGLMKGHQLGGSALGENFIGRCITTAAGNILAVFATYDDAEKWEMDRFEPMRSSTPDLRRRVRDAMKKGSENTKLRKKFPGGLMNLVSATRAGRLKSTTVRYVLLEEIDEYVLNVDGQGNPIELAKNRTSNFGRRAKIFANSTPTIKRRSQIEKLYETGDQRRYFVRCPDCGSPQFFDWRKGMRRSPDDPGVVLYYCQTGCGAGNPESVWKTRGYEGAYWMPTAVGDSKTASFHLSALYAPLGWRPWSDLMDDWEAAQTDTDKMIAFVNNALAECWEDKSAEMKWETIKRRAEPYKLRTIPLGCLLLTCAVDTQNDRLEAEISGWGRGMRNWTVDHVVFRGDPALPDVWNQLDRYLDTPITNQFGVPMRIELCAVDSGGSRTQDVYDYCRLRRHRGVFAIKGAKEKHKPIIGRPTDQDVTVKGKTYPNGVKLWPVGTDTAKSRIFGALLGDEDREVVDRRMHFSVDLDDEYFEQLTAEAYNPSKDRWDKLRKRNEALDLKVYNFACAYHPRLRLNAYQDADWAALEAVIEPRVQDLFASVPAHDVPVQVPVPVPAPEPAGAAEPADADIAVLDIVPDTELAVATVDTASEPAAPATNAGATQNSWIPRRDNWLRR